MTPGEGFLQSDKLIPCQSDISVLDTLIGKKESDLFRSTEGIKIDQTVPREGITERD